MDLSALFAFGFAAVLSAIVAVVTRHSAKPPSRLIPFTLSLSVCMLLFRPWESLAPGEWQEGLVVILVLIAWIAAGTVVGSAVTKRFARP
jgi:hypothetical protein